MTLTDIRAWTLDRIRTLDGVTVFDGRFDPKETPLVAGTSRVAPYIVVWRPTVREPDETALSYTGPERQGRLNATVAASNAGSVANIANTVVDLLHRVTIPGGHEYRHTDPYLDVMWDETVTPGRYYLPITFALHTV